MPTTSDSMTTPDTTLPHSGGAGRPRRSCKQTKKSHSVSARAAFQVALGSPRFLAAGSACSADVIKSRVDPTLAPQPAERGLPAVAA